jgi:hypothetical protein
VTAGALESVEVLSADGRTKSIIPAALMRFGYRSSPFQSPRADRMDDGAKGSAHRGGGEAHGGVHHGQTANCSSGREMPRSGDSSTSVVASGSGGDHLSADNLGGAVITAAGSTPTQHTRWCLTVSAYVCTHFVHLASFLQFPALTLAAIAVDTVEGGLYPVD